MNEKRDIIIIHTSAGSEVTVGVESIRKRVTSIGTRSTIMAINNELIIFERSGCWGGRRSG